MDIKNCIICGKTFTSADKYYGFGLCNICFTEQNKSNHDRITALETELAERKKECDFAIEAMFNQDVKLEGLKKQLANSVPFEVVYKICAHGTPDGECLHPKMKIRRGCAQEAKDCPLIPKPEQEEVVE